MELNPNDGSRLSKLALGRYATQELSADERAIVEEQLGEPDRAWLRECEDARESLPSFDPTLLRARAGQQISVATPLAAPANRVWMGVLALMAAALLAFVLMPTTPREVEPDYIGIRGTQAPIEVHVWDGGELRPWAGQPVGDGDRLGFAVQANGHQAVVLLSVDGNGQVSVFWPESGNAPQPLHGDGLVRLPGSVTLDGAPGPEVFLAVYDLPADEARDVAQRTWQSGGPEALTEWAKTADHVEAVVLERR